MDNLLNEVLSGRVACGMGQKLAADADNTLVISRIASPVKPSPAKDLSGLTLHQAACPASQLFLHDHMDNYIGAQYRRGNQVHTASFLNPGGSQTICSDTASGFCSLSSHGNLIADNIGSPELFSVKIHPKIVRVKSQHRRTNSDLNESSNPARKWHIYENKKVMIQPVKNMPDT